MDPDSDAWYVDKTRGTRLAFSPKPDEAIVRFADESLAQVVAAPAVRSVSRGADERRGIAALHVTPGWSADEIPGVRDAVPAMVDADGLIRYFLPDELTVQFRDGVGEERSERLITGLGSRIVRRQRTAGYFTVAVPEGRSLFAAIRAFTDQDEVAFAEPSEVGFNDALYLPDDPDFPTLWGMRNTGQTVNGVAGAAGVDIAAAEAWDLHRGRPEVIVTVIDTGADLNHPDLLDNLLSRGTEDWDFADAGDPSPDDGFGHGTHVAGTAAAVDNQIGVIGVAPACRIMPLRVDLTAGVNQNRADAINYVRGQAAANPARRYVINCSWRTSGDHIGIRTAIENTVGAGVLIVFAAGNASQNTDVTPEFPGVYPQVIAVAALDQNGMRASFSNFGSNVDVSAPGVNIFSCLPDDTYGFLDGTSMAAPHVTGLAALVWSVEPGLTNSQVRRIIEDTCDDVDPANPGFAGLLGRGRINAFRAVQLAQFTAGYVPSAPAFG
jgi:subtilisin family serine protease